MANFKNKKIIIVAITLFMALTLGLGLVFTNLNKNGIKANAETPYFAIEDGISIKLNEDGGMRFIAKMDTTLGEALINGEKEMQFIIAPTAIFDYADQNGIEYVNLPKKIVVDVDPQKVYPDDAENPTCYYANGCVINMYEGNFNLDYEAVGYIVGERYTERNANASGTYYEKVNATFLNQNVEEQILSFETYDSWYGTAKYPIYVKNSEQYNRLVEKCNGGNTAFNGKVIICENDVPWDSNNFTNEEAKPEKSDYLTVTYKDAKGNDYQTFKVVKGAQAPKPAMSPTKDSADGYDYKFSAWQNDGATWDFTSQTVEENLVFTPNFAKTPIQYTITYHNMEHASNPNPTTYTVETDTFAFEKASKEGYYFDGWYTDGNFNTSFSGIEKGTTGNKDVYASFIDTDVLTNEIRAWQGENLGSSLNSNVVVDSFGGYNVYTTKGGYSQTIANTSIDASNYYKLYFAFKTDKNVMLSSGTYGVNMITPNTWYFVQLERKADGSWAIFTKAFGESDYKALTADVGSFGINATFASMFHTYLWIDGTNNTDNHEIYATDVWGETVVDSEITAWENAGAKKIGSALNSSEALSETLDGLAVYKTSGGYGESIVNTSIDASNYCKLYFAFKATQRVNLSSGDYNTNVITPDTWYFVKLEKQEDASWKIFAKALGKGEYTEFVASTEFFSASNATFATMFRTYLWTDDTFNHEVYATDVWGETVVDSEITAWENAGAKKVGSALNSSEALSETLGGLAVYKTNGGYSQSIVNTSIDASNYYKLYFAFKTDKDVMLSNGTYGVNMITPNTWYFVKLDKQADGSWIISVKKVGDSDYVAFTAEEGSFGTGNATFDSMFKTRLWIADAMENNHEVYATDVWGESVFGRETTALEDAGAKNLGSALNSSDALGETLFGFEIYKTNGGYGQSIVNTSIDVSKYSRLHFAFKATEQVNLSNGDYQTNVITPNVWYFVKLERQQDGSWKIFAKVVGASDYVEFTASAEFFGVKATFETMFRTYLWTANTFNHEVYATDVWGVEVEPHTVVEGMIDSLPSEITNEDIGRVISVYNEYLALSIKQQEKVNQTTLEKLNGSFAKAVNLEISAWESAGLTNTDLNALASGTPAGKWGNLAISSVINTGYDVIANANVNINNFERLYFAVKTDLQAFLSSGSTNEITANTWYFVKLEKQADGSWKIFAKAFGESDYVELTASEEFFGAGNATFETVFKTYNWSGVPYNVYATEVWAGKCSETNAVWDGTTYRCGVCQKVLGSMTETLTETQEIVLFTNATYAGENASGNGFDASAEREITIDLSGLTDLEISDINNLKLNGVAYTVIGLEDNRVTIDGVVPYDVFGEYILTAQITVKGGTFDIEMPILIITDLITNADGLLNVRKILRGQDLVINPTTANPVVNLVNGGTGGLGTMNGKGYYKLGADIDLLNYSIANVNTNTTNSYNRVFVFGTSSVPFSGTFDGAGYVLNNFISKPNFWNNNEVVGFSYLFQDPKGATGDSHAHEIEASLFGIVDGTVKNLAVTNAVFGQNGNVVNGGGGRLENVYVQINDLQAEAHTFVAPIAQHFGENNMTLTNVVVDLTKHNSAILNGSTAVLTHYPSVIGAGAVNIENVGVYGFNTAWINESLGNVYANNTDGSEVGIYTAGITMSSNANFWQVSLDPAVWKIVDGVPMLIKVSSSTATEDGWTGEEGDGYNISWNEEVAGSYEAVTKIRAVTNQVTDNVIGVTAEDGANIIVGSYDRYAKDAGVDVSLLATDGRVNYGVYNRDGKIFVLADGEDGFSFAADMLLRQLYGYNELANNSFAWEFNTISLENVESQTAQVVFSDRESANGYNKGDMNVNATETYTTYGHMHNALDYLYATDGNGNITGSEIVPVTASGVTYTTTSYWLSSGCDDARDGDNTSGEQLCYLAHGDKTAFNALVDHVVNRILEKATAIPDLTAINFMIEDDPEYCMCSVCKPFYNPSIPQLIFLNTVAEKLEKEEDLINSCRTIDIVFFAYSSFANAPITSTTVATDALANAKSALELTDTATETVKFTYEGMNKAGATYSAATDTTERSVLKAHKNLRLQWTSHKAFHSYALTHEANSTIYLDLMAWLASVDSSKIEVFTYQTTFADYFLPLNTWKYQVEWYKNLNAMGINGYIFNLGDFNNPADAQTGFSAFKAYIDSRAMTDSTVTYEQLKNEFFGENGYYGAAGPKMRTFFEELESVMEGKKQSADYVDYVNFSHFDYDATNSPYYHYYTDGTSKQAVRTSQADRIQAWFNGAFDLSKVGVLFGDIDGALNVATSVEKYSYPDSAHAALTFTPKTDVYNYGGNTQLDTLKAWYGYCVTAQGEVAADSVYARRIQVESWFPEYALRLFHSTYTVNFNLTKSSFLSDNYTAECTGVTSTLDENIGLSRSATEFYNELISFGMISPSELNAFNTTGKLSLGWVQKFYKKDGVTVFENANCVCEISASMFVNWGVDFGS